MRCRYCNIALAPARSFVDGEFCCDDHRRRFESATPDLPLTAIERLRLIFAPHVEAAGLTEPEGFSAELEFSAPCELAEDPDLMSEPEVHSESGFKERAEQFAEQADEEVTEQIDTDAGDAPPHPAHETAGSRRRLTTAWEAAPRDLKLVALLLPVLLVIAVTGSVPKVPIQQLSPSLVNRIAAGEVIVTAGQMKLRNGVFVVVDNSITPSNEINPTPPNE